MSRTCPNCSAEITFKRFLTPRARRYFPCERCGQKVGFDGVIAWSIEVLYLGFSAIIYSMVDGNWLQFSVVLPFAFLFGWFEYRFAEMRLYEK